MRKKIGDHSVLSLDQIAEENLRRGLVRVQRDVLMTALRDPRLDTRDRRLLGAIIERMNNATGVALPGRKTLADDTGYTMAGVAKSISKLLGLGYLVLERRVPDGAKQMIAHYAIANPSIKDLTIEDLGPRQEPPTFRGLPFWHPQVAEYRQFVSTLFHGQCQYCGAADRALQVEHIVPRSDVGSDKDDNLTAACAPCNQAKGFGEFVGPVRSVAVMRRVRGC